MSLTDGTGDGRHPQPSRRTASDQDALAFNIIWPVLGGSMGSVRDLDQDIGDPRELFFLVTSGTYLALGSQHPVAAFEVARSDGMGEITPSVARGTVHGRLPW
jgi:hypothetical protein